MIIILTFCRRLYVKHALIDLYRKMPEKFRPQLFDDSVSASDKKIYYSDNFFWPLAM
jgi:hypothetical protein